MGNKMGKHKHPTLLEILEHYDEQRLAYERYVRALYRDARVEVEHERRLRAARAELDNAFALLCIAATEATIRNFVSAIVESDRHDAFALRARRLHERFGDRVPFEEVLDLWKPATGLKSHAGSEIGEFKSQYKHRHWLAHGRYWPNRSGVAQLDPTMIVSVLRGIRQVTTDFPIRV